MAKYILIVCVYIKKPVHKMLQHLAMTKETDDYCNKRVSNVGLG